MDGDEGERLQVCISKKTNPADEVMLEEWLHLRPKLCGFGVTMVEPAGHGDIVSKALRQKKQGLYETLEYKQHALCGLNIKSVDLSSYTEGPISGYVIPKLKQQTF
ncbi:hypothetical protein C1H46_033521 [Malus baccata]|uniref:Uncharacterized protein n=1 Tax=Malus baccata TaxID=106549 RepID=A0A540L397_MALBA|nr:hypothetical protein C1H46_033521 [Malus baccata]